MPLTNSRQLPGIEFEVVPPAVEEALPRMDIAAFVGFTTSGPVDTPTVVEDMDGFRDIFGADVELARDPGTGRTLYSQLGPAVEAFFKNGGKRCWVVRVGIEVDTSPASEGRKKFDSGLFLDPDLVGIGAAALLGEAHHKHYIQKEPEPLQGIHSLLPIEEVTLISVPDAVQTGWKNKSLLPPQILDAPVLQLDPIALLLEWSNLGDNVIYTLQESENPLFREAITLNRGNETHFTIEPRRPCPGNYFYRVNARSSERISPWSNTVGAVLPAADFEDCRMLRLKAPVLSLVPGGSPPGSEFEPGLEWSLLAGAEGYVLEEAETPDFEAAAVVYEGEKTSFTIKYRSPGSDYFYRVRAIGTDLACWSNTCIYASPGADIWLARDPEDYKETQREELLKIHYSLLCFCAARGDMFAILDLPFHFKENEALEYVEELRNKCGGETQILSYGALYHPWAYMSIDSGYSGYSNDTITPIDTSDAKDFSSSGTKAKGRAMLYIPPGGAVCGLMAGRAIRRGAWIAPANETLNGITALEPVISTGSWQKLYAEQINVVRQTPRGFLLLSADTLIKDNKALQPINVRRLLILLRRLVMREGMTYVFQPNHRDFHRRVQHRFEQFLARMYTLGAFAGDKPETSYQVVIDSSVNTTASLRQGRFIIELRVAPSLPMIFITVRLVQSQNEGITIMEI